MKRQMSAALIAGAASLFVLPAALTSLAQAESFNVPPGGGNPPASTLGRGISGPNTGDRVRANRGGGNPRANRRGGSPRANRGGGNRRAMNRGARNRAANRNVMRGGGGNRNAVRRGGRNRGVGGGGRRWVQGHPNGRGYYVYNRQNRVRGWQGNGNRRWRNRGFRNRGYVYAPPRRLHRGYGYRNRGYCRGGWLWYNGFRYRHRRCTYRKGRYPLGWIILGAAFLHHLLTPPPYYYHRY